MRSNRHTVDLPVAAVGRAVGREVEARRLVEEVAARRLVEDVVAARRLVEDVPVEKSKPNLAMRPSWDEGRPPVALLKTCPSPC